MARKVIWTPEALQDLAGILNYLLDTYHVAVSDNFTRAIEDQVARIMVHPELGLASTSLPEIRRILISEHNSMFYSLEGDDLLILKILDTRSRRYNQQR